MKKAVCLLSGGMDSTTLAYYAKSIGYEIFALHTRYGQRTEAREAECAKRIASLLGVVEYTEISLSHLHAFGGSSLTDPKMDVHDHDKSNAEGIPNTYVPFRNANLLSIATSYAEAKGAQAIFIGVQASDYAGYPDCRPEFIEAFQRVIDIGTPDDTDISLVTPFVNMNKTEIVRKGTDLNVPYEYTWSCYRSNAPACGRCDSCYYRLEAFKANGISDPIDYE